MKVPIDWLKDLISFRAGPDQLAKMLTAGGLETFLLPDDILEVDILPNRSDCLSIRGIAREVSALTKFKVKPYKIRVKENSKKISSFMKVEVRDKDLCPRYMARVIENVKVGESPEWLKKRLEKVGLRPINNVVDATNYLLHEIGQPLHAFNASMIKEQFMVIRRANPGEKTVTIDGKEHQLEPEMLVIADPEKVIAVGGIMGAANTEVDSLAKTIILESAYFNPISVHKTSKSLKLTTEASVRFGHGVDWNAVEEALDKGAALIAELSRGEVLRGKIDVVGKPKKNKTIELRTERIGKVLGIDVPVGDVISILKRLGFSVDRNGSKLKIEAPLYREGDIEREIDLIGEIARIWGYNRINATLPNTAFSGKETGEFDLFREKVGEILCGCGLSEAQSYSMLSEKDFARAELSLDKAVRIANPMNIDESVLRTSLVPGLLKSLSHNQNRQVENIFIFEIGKVFHSLGEKLPNEGWHVSGAAVGSPFLSALDGGEADYFYVKGVIENIFNGLGIALPQIENTQNPLLQPGTAARIKEIGCFGALHPDIQNNFEIVRPVMIFDIDLNALFAIAKNTNKYAAVPKFPFVSRDISMFVDAAVQNQGIIDVIKMTGGEIVESAYPFDRYKDSIAYRVVYRSGEKTLTEEEVNAKHQKIIDALVEKLRVRIR